MGDKSHVYLSGMSENKNAWMNYKWRSNVTANVGDWMDPKSDECILAIMQNVSLLEGE